MRSKSVSNYEGSGQNDKQKSTIEDDLKWVEENVPATLAEA